MKQESPTTLDIGIQQQKSFDAAKAVAKENSVKNAIKETVAKVDEKVGNNDNEVNNDDNNDNPQNPQPIDKQIPDVQPMEITNENEIKSVVTNGNDQNLIDSNINNNNNSNSKSKSKSNNNNNININKDDSKSNGKEIDEIDEMANKELLSKLSATLAEFYGGGDNYEIKEPQKKRPRSCAKVSSIVLTKEGEENTFPEIKIRDFAYPEDDPRHWGQIIPSEEEEEEEEEEEDSEFINRRAIALYDFVGENSSELSFREGNILLIQNRPFEGWLMANLGEETGLVPENYIKWLDEDEDEDEYGNWAEEGNNDEQEG